MKRRFTIVQGGFSGPRSGSAAGTMRAACWRIVLRRPAAVAQSEFADWRALAESQPRTDPFVHPDYLLTAARHGARGGDVAFGFAYARAREGAEALGGVLPLAMPHPVWGGSATRLWHPPLAPRPVEPIFETGAIPAAIEALLRHLRAENPRAQLRLERIAAGGSLLREMEHDRRLRVEIRPSAAPIPEASFVGTRGGEAEPQVERVTAMAGIRDAVERFLLVEAQRSAAPLLADPAAATIARVVARLFAHRGWICVELGRRGDALVSGAIRLGREGERVLWRAVNVQDALPVLPRTADADVALREDAACDGRPARLSLVGS